MFALTPWPRSGWRRHLFRGIRALNSLVEMPLADARPTPGRIQDQSERSQEPFVISLTRRRFRGYIDSNVERGRPKISVRSVAAWIVPSSCGGGIWCGFRADVRP